MVVSVCSVALWCPTLCDPTDYSSPGSSLHGILQARILEWTAVPFSRGSSQPRDLPNPCVSCIGRQVLSHCACGSLLVRYFISNCTGWWISGNAFKRWARLLSFLLGQHRSRTMKTDAPRDMDSEFIDSKKTARPPEIGTKRVVLQTVPAGEEEQFYSAERKKPPWQFPR